VFLKSRVVALSLMSVAVALALGSLPVFTQDDAPSTLPGERQYSPYPAQTFPNRVYFDEYDFTAKDRERSNFAANGYAKGVPMGGDLKAAPAGKVPTFLVAARRDADGANLDRIQIVKGWRDAQGKPQERVYDVAWSGQKEKTRKPGKDGKLPAAGNTVNVPDASYTNPIGAPYLAAHWKGPRFNPKQRAFYYVRVLEIPTPRWTTFDAERFKVTLHRDVPASVQERAYTSPIWYTPE